MVDLIFDVIFVLAFATIELVWLAVLEGLEEIVAIPTVDDVRAVGFSVEPVVLAVAPVVRESDAPITYLWPRRSRVRAPSVTLLYSVHVTELAESGDGLAFESDVSNNILTPPRWQ